MTVALEVTRATVIRGASTLLEDVSLNAGPGEVIALVGPNGAGKSTLLGVIAGDISPDRGQVNVHACPLVRIGVGQLARLRAVLPQQASMQFGFRGREVVAMGRMPLPAAVRDRDDAAIDAALRKTDALHLADRRFPTLSGGEQTRVSLSRVLAQETGIVLLDEPTAALDIRHQHKVMSIARELARNGGTVIAILHDLNLAMLYADRIAVLDRGRLVADGGPWDVARSGALTEAFQCPLTVIDHPHRACPLVLSTGPEGPDDILPGEVHSRER